MTSGRQLSVSFLNAGDNLGGLDNCKLVYVATTSDKQVRKVLRHLQDRPSLTVGESDNFLKMGGMIHFVRVDNKVRFAINTDAVDKAGLKISSNVLKIAVRLVAGR